MFEVELDVKVENKDTFWAEKLRFRYKSIEKNSTSGLLELVWQVW